MRLPEDNRLEFVKIHDAEAAISEEDLGRNRCELAPSNVVEEGLARPRLRERFNRTEQ